MQQRWARLVVSGVVLLAGAVAGRAADEPGFTRTPDVVYGRKFGTALTMDVFTPKKDANGVAVISVISGGWFSSHESINVGLCNEFVKRGYTVFAVVHGSQPRYTIPEAIADMNRAVRFIRFHAKDYHIDPDRIGITGGSAGGHLSLMQGMAGDAGDPKAADPVERTSSRIQAIACFFPPTDFLNYGKKGVDMIESGIPDRLKLRAPFAFNELDKDKNVFVPITDPHKVHEIMRRISPITHVTKDAPPTLIIHGDKDQIVPIQQAQVLVARLKEAGVAVELIVKKDADHGWGGMDKDLITFIDWFDKYLKKAKSD